MSEEPKASMLTEGFVGAAMASSRPPTTTQRPGGGEQKGFQGGTVTGRPPQTQRPSPNTGPKK
jgi:hypothetical protein